MGALALALAAARFDVLLNHARLIHQDTTYTIIRKFPILLEVFLL